MCACGAPHNQYAAEVAFGVEFMRHKRAAARKRSATCATNATNATRAAPAATEHPEARAVAEDRDVVPWLRQLGFSAAETRRAAEACESLPDASLEERLRLALRVLCPPHRRPRAAAPTAM
jgi:hypothetical protein